MDNTPRRRPVSYNNQNHTKNTNTARRPANTGTGGKKPAAKPAKKLRPRQLAIRIIAISMCVLLVAAVASVVALYQMYKEVSKDPLSVLTQGNTGHTVTVAGEDGSEGNYVRQDHLINILLLGIDSNDDREAASMGWRSDVMILCSLDFDKKIMTMMSIPRDTYVPMNKLDYKTGEIKTRTENKINAAYTFGGGPKKFGDKNAVDCVKEFLSCDGRLEVPIDYYASIDMDGIPKLVNAVGGVEITLEQNLAGYGKKGQTITINKSNVDDFVRRRHDDGGGDSGRNNRQQQLIMGILKKVKSMGAVNAASKLYNEVLAYINTNVSLEEALALASFLQGFSLDTGINQYRVETTPKRINGKYCEIADKEALYNFVLSHFYAAA